ncbi:MAG: DUF624 domain-containing protein [Saccharofermentans sp.]|nr:DUF624 domain-containing protein [Saccharofermentans sp.]
MESDRSDVDLKKEQRAKGPFARFFISGWSNIVRLMAVNALFLIFNIPSLVISYFAAMAFIPVLAPALKWSSFITIVAEDGTEQISFQLYSLLVIFFIMTLVSSCLVCIGPFQAGFAQVYKGLRTNNSVSLMGDFKRGLKENWGKALVSMFIGIVITAILLLAISFYLNLGTTVGLIIGVVFEILLVAFILIQNFVYQLMVSTDLSLFKIYKNAMLFLFVRFVPCFTVALVVLIFYIAVPFVLLMSASYLTLGLYLFLYSFLVISWMQYFLAYFTGYLINRYVSEEKDENSVDNAIELDSNEENSGK